MEGANERRGGKGEYKKRGKELGDKEEEDGEKQWRRIMMEGVEGKRGRKDGD